MSALSQTVSVLVESPRVEHGPDIGARTTFLADLLDAVAHLAAWDGSNGDNRVQAFAFGQTVASIVPLQRWRGLAGKTRTLPTRAGSFAQLDPAMVEARERVGLPGRADVHLLLMVVSADSRITVPPGPLVAGEVVGVIQLGSCTLEPAVVGLASRIRPLSLPLVLTAEQPEQLLALGRRLARGIENARQTGASLVDVLTVMAGRQEAWRTRSNSFATWEEWTDLLAEAAADPYLGSVDAAALDAALQRRFDRQLQREAVARNDSSALARIPAPDDADLARAVAHARDLETRRQRAQDAFAAGDGRTLSREWADGTLSALGALGPELASALGQEVRRELLVERLRSTIEANHPGVGSAILRELDDLPGTPLIPELCRVALTLRRQEEAAQQLAEAARLGDRALIKATSRARRAGLLPSDPTIDSVVQAAELRLARVERIRDALVRGKLTRVSEVYHLPGIASTDLLSESEHQEVRRLIAYRAGKASPS